MIRTNDCDTPLTINIAPPVAAKCVKLELTKVLQLGGGIWWAIDELQTYPQRAARFQSERNYTDKCPVMSWQ
jgi:hypothetical protein